MEFINSIMTWVIKKRIHEVELFKKYPLDMQEEVLKKLLYAAESTEFGKKYEFHKIHNYKDFADQIPLVTYEQFHPYIERLLKGEQNITWPSDIRWFAKSSGTTNARSKFIPVSDEAMEDCHFKGGKDMLSIYVNNYPDSHLFAGKSLTIGGSHQINQFDDNSNSYYGDVSAVIMKNLPIWVKIIRTPSMEIALLDNWEEKIERMAHATMNENVVSISGVPTWTVVLLQRILELKQASHIHEVWPNLEVFIHGAVAFGPYKELFKKLIPSEKMHYMETYNASEGFFAIQDQTDSDDMLLMLDYGVYYEFIPIEDELKQNPRVVNLAGVVVDQIYSMVISTNAGLWRYRIGDTVRFTSVDPYRIKIAGRTKHFINAFGEELIIENAETAIAYACEQTGSIISNFTAGPRYLEEGKKGGHEWIIEFVKTPDDLNKYSELLDQKLRDLNSDYDAKRKANMALEMPVLHSVPEGTFYNWMKKRGKIGGQHKVPRLANNREYVEDLLKMIHS